MFPKRILLEPVSPGTLLSLPPVKDNAASFQKAARNIE